MYYGEGFTTCGFSILYSRSKLQILFQVYLPASILVVISWASFLIDPYIVPGRMGLLVTLLLVLVNIFNGFKNSSPPSSNLNALDMYVLVCICHVFCSLIQYAIVLILGNFKIKVALVLCHKIHHEIPTNHTTYYTRNQGYGEKQKQHHMNTFDLTSLIVFPMFFILCVILYCISYI